MQVPIIEKKNRQKIKIPKGWNSLKLENKKFPKIFYLDSNKATLYAIINTINCNQALPLL